MLEPRHSLFLARVMNIEGWSKAFRIHGLGFKFHYHCYFGSLSSLLCETEVLSLSSEVVRELNEIIYKELSLGYSE
jgi:hypothetical protein